MSTPAPTLPPFYSEPVPLNGARHADWRLLPGDAAFAAATSAIPVTASEFAAACRAYPILFPAQGGAPVALTGLDGRNLFVEDGQWSPGAYVPAYVRRYPFLLIAAADNSGFALSIDEASVRVAKTGEDGVRLFEAGEPTELTRQALEFCRQFNLDHQWTLEFCAALGGADLLVERRADASLPDGRRLGVEGFRVIDPERLTALDDALVTDWHRKGWLGLIHHHLASLQGFNDLLTRQAAPQASAAPTAEKADPVAKLRARKPLSQSPVIG